MNANTAAMNAYRNVGVQSGVTDASPHQLIVMLLDGAMDRIAAAKGAMTRKETAKQGELVGKAITIVDNMRASLDYEKGGELASTLGDLYDYMQRRLLEANSTSSVEMLDEVRGLLAEIKAGWVGMPAQYK